MFTLQSKLDICGHMVCTLYKSRRLVFPKFISLREKRSLWIIYICSMQINTFISLELPKKINSIWWNCTFVTSIYWYKKCANRTDHKFYHEWSSFVLLPIASRRPIQSYRIERGKEWVRNQYLCTDECIGYLRKRGDVFYERVDTRYARHTK